RLLTWLNSSTAALKTGWGSQLQFQSSKFVSSLSEALQKVVGVRADLESAEYAYPFTRNDNPRWPGFFCLLAGVREQPTGTFAVSGLHIALNTLPNLEADPLDEEATPSASGAETQARALDKL